MLAPTADNGSSPVDVVFVDVQLSAGENGLDLIRSMRADVNRPAFVLAIAFSRHAPKARDLGAAEYLPKPFSEEQVERCLRRLIHPSRHGIFALTHAPSASTSCWFEGGGVVTSRYR